MHNALNITEEQIKELQENVDAVYMYIDLHVDEMSQEEKDAWLKILETIDPDYYNEENE